MVLPYDFNAMQLSLSGFNPQMNNTGMLEFHINHLIPGGKQVLILGLDSFNLPSPRSVPKATVQYLFGNINYPGKPGAIENLTCSFTDYVDGNQRQILHKWFDFVYNERTGLGVLPSWLKCNAHAVLFGPDGITRGTYFMRGVFPLNDPAPPDISFGRGEIVKIAMNFSVDFIFEEFIGGGAVVAAAGAVAGLGRILGAGAGL